MAWTSFGMESTPIWVKMFTQSSYKTIKLLIPVISFLRTQWGVNITIYMDDMLLQAPSKEIAYFHAQLTILLLLCLGWEVNWEKSNLNPTQNITHLGFEIDD